MKTTILKILPVCLALVLLNNANAQEVLKDTCKVTIGENFIVFDAEATESPLDKWELITEEDDRYYDNDPIKPLSGTHLEFTGNDHNSGPPTSPLKYKFIAPKTGTYRLTMRMYQRLDGQPEDKCNDVYIRMTGNFTSGNSSYTTADLKSNMKFWGRGINKWGNILNGENSSHVKQAVMYNLIEGEEYSFFMSGRAQRTNIDYILFFETSLGLSVQYNVDLASTTDEKYHPAECDEVIPEETLTNKHAFADDKSLFTVAPNPATSGVLNIQFVNNSQVKKEVTIVDLSGRTVHSEYTNANQLVLSTDMISSPGIYLIKVSTQEYTSISKVQIQ